MRQYFHDLMYDKRNEPLSQIVKLSLLILSYIYGLLVRLHHFFYFYKVSLLKSYKSRFPIISVGNITLGGTGKTPFVIMLAEHLARKNGEKPTVLIRGYGEDEWKLLEDRLGGYGVRVLVGRNRVKNIKTLSHLVGVTGLHMLILDDGFQHRCLKRDLDIVLIDSTSPFGNRHLFPRGILREPLEGLRRADFIVLTKVDKGKKNIRAVENEIKKIAPDKTILKAVHVPKELFGIRNSKRFRLDWVNGKTVSVLSAICDPSYFRYIVEKLGARVGLEFAFPDHHSYKRRDLNHIFEECQRRDINTIVTTEKDSVKLEKLLTKDKPQILVLCIELDIVEGKEALNAYLDRLHMRYSGQDT